LIYWSIILSYPSLMSNHDGLGRWLELQHLGQLGEYPSGIYSPDCLNFMCQFALTLQGDRSIKSTVSNAVEVTHQQFGGKAAQSSAQCQGCPSRGVYRRRGGIELSQACYRQSVSRVHKSVAGEFSASFSRVLPCGVDVCADRVS
jgi:hypothetical protein